MTEHYEHDAVVAHTIKHSTVIAGTPEHEPDPEWINDIELEMGETPTVNVCDFCTAPGPVWTYPVAKFATPLAGPDVYVDDGEWYACDACYQDIEVDRWPAVVQRYAERNPQFSATLLDRMLRAFIKARSGPPVRLHQHA